MSVWYMFDVYSFTSEVLLNDESYEKKLRSEISISMSMESGVGLNDDDNFYVCQLNHIQWP